LVTAGEAYHAHRRQVMLARQEGLTKTYNRFHDPQETSEDIRKLRQLHVEMDQAVAAAYGWAALDLGHGFHQTRQGLRYTISEPARQEVLARLLRLNHQRYAEEVAQGLHDAKRKAPGTARGGNRRAPRKRSAGKTLFGDEEEGSGPPAGEEREHRREQGDEPAERDRPPPAEDLDTEQVMAAFRQAARGRGWVGRLELLRAVAAELGYQRLGSRLRKALKGHMKAAVRRKILEADGHLVRAATAAAEDYNLGDLRGALCSVMRTGQRYGREDVIHAVARHLGFERVRETVLRRIKSAINSAIRQGVLRYEGEWVWRE
jgi:hypothetical protein